MREIVTAPSTGFRHNERHLPEYVVTVCIKHYTTVKGRTREQAEERALKEFEGKFPAGQPYVLEVEEV